MRVFMSLSLEFCGLKPPWQLSFCQDMSGFLQSACECVIVYVNTSADAVAVIEVALLHTPAGADIMLTGCAHLTQNKPANNY